MKRINLYYPSINIPDGNWLKSSILYSDKVSSIVPFEDLNDNRLSDDTKLLIDSDLYEPVHISDYKYRHEHEFNKLTNRIREVIESTEFAKLEQHVSKVKWDDPGGASKFAMYAEKFDEETAEYLKSKKLLERGKYGIFNVEKHASIIYMSILASFVSENSQNNEFITSTDKIEYERLGQQLSDSKVASNRLILEHCLPVPSKNTSLQEIINFKIARKNELLKFRKVIREVENDLSSLSDKKDQTQRMIQFKEDIEIELSEIDKLLKDSKIDFVLNSFSSLLKFKKPEIIGTLASAGLVIANIPLATIGVGIGGLLLTTTLINDWRKIGTDLNSNKMSYLYHAQKEGIFKNI